MYRSTSAWTRVLTTPRYVYRVSWCPYRCPSCILGSIPVNRRATVASDPSGPLGPVGVFCFSAFSVSGYLIPVNSVG